LIIEDISSQPVHTDTYIRIETQRNRDRKIDRERGGGGKKRKGGERRVRVRKDRSAGDGNTRDIPSFSTKLYTWVLRANLPLSRAGKRTLAHM